MYIDIKKLNVRGFNVTIQTDKQERPEGISIGAIEPVYLDWQPMQKQLEELEITVSNGDVEEAVDRFTRDIEVCQIMKAIKD